MFPRPLIVWSLWLFVSFAAAPPLQALLAVEAVLAARPVQAVQAEPELESLRALLSAGKDLEAEQGALARVAAIERDRGPDDLEIAQLLDLVLEARLALRRVANSAGSQELAERALRIKEKAYGPDDPRVADTLVLVTYARRDAKSRLAAVERAVAIHEKALGPGRESLGLTRALSTLAWVHWQARRMPLAIQTGERALAMARRLESPPGQETASALNTLAGSRRTNGELEKSVPLYEEALSIEEGMRGPDHPATTFTMIGFTGALFDVGEFDRARALGERAIDILERTPGSERRLAFEMISLSNSLETYGEYAAAFAMCERGVAVAERATGADSAVTLAGLNKLAALHLHLGDHAAASAIRARTLERWIALQGAESLHAATALLELAMSYESAGDIDNASETLDRAMKMKALQDQPIVYADAFELLGSLLLTRGRLPEARAALERAHAMDAASKFDSGRRGQAATLRLLGRLERREGQPARAIPLYRDAVQLMEREYGPASIHTAEARTEYAEALAEAGQIEGAREALIKSEAASLDHLRLIARALPDRRALAFAAERRSGVDLAVTLATRHASVSAAAAAARTGSRAAAVGKAAAGASANKVGAVDAAGRGAAGAARTRSGAVAIDEAAAGASANKVGAVDAAGLGVAAAARTGSGAVAIDEAAAGASANEAGAVGAIGRGAAGAGAARAGVAAGVDVDTEMAFQMLIQGRTVVLDEMASRQRTVIAEAENAVVRERWNALNRARARLANLIVGGAEGSSSAQEQTLVERTRAERDRAERELAEVSAAFQREQRRSQAGVRDVLARLPEGAVLVSYVRYTPRRLPGVAPDGGASASGGPRARAQGSNAKAQGSKADATPGETAASGEAEASGHASAPGEAAPAYAAFVGRAGSPLRAVTLGKAEAIEAAIATWRERIQAELTSGGLASRRTEAAYREAGAALRALLWDPIAKHLGTARTAFIVPDGAIHLVDLSTLPTGRTGYLIDSPLALHYLLAERDLVQPPPEPHGRSLLALGAPDFDKVDRAAVDALTTPHAIQGERAAATQAERAGATGARASSAPSSSAQPASPSQSSSPSPVAMAAANVAPTGAMTRQVRSACEALMSRRFDPLPATRQEMQRIAQLWRQGGVNSGPQVTAGSAAGAAGNAAASDASDASADVLLLGDDRASESAFKALARGRRVLHLATHGFFLDRFCGANPADADADASTNVSTNARLSTNTSAGVNSNAGASATARPNTGTNADSKANAQTNAKTNAGAASTATARGGANPTDVGAGASTNVSTNARSSTNASASANTGANSNVGAAAASRGSATRAAMPRVLEESPLLRSGLVLAGANRQASGALQRNAIASGTAEAQQAALDDDDGILTAEEIAGLDLTAAQWAVLSACDTGRGDWQAGEGVVGLRRAFEVAGARTVIISLWPVIDRVASDWMAELYRGKFVGNLTTATAVRGASRKLLAERRAAKASTHPLYWSGFIATGDWR